MYQNRGGRAVGGMGQPAWTPQQNPTRGRAAVIGGSAAGGGGATAKRTCAGTGVFLPRRYENINDCNAYSSDSHRKPGILQLSAISISPHFLAIVFWNYMISNFGGILDCFGFGVLLDFQFLAIFTIL